MSLCTEGGAATTPRSPRGEWTAKKVLHAMTDALCTFLDTHYFVGHDPSHDEVLPASTKAEAMYVGYDDDDDRIEPEGGKRSKGPKVVAEEEGAFFLHGARPYYAECGDENDASSSSSPENMLYAYEHMIREGVALELPTHDLVPGVTPRGTPPAAVVVEEAAAAAAASPAVVTRETRKHWQQLAPAPLTLRSSTPLPAAVQAVSKARNATTKASPPAPPPAPPPPKEKKKKALAPKKALLAKLSTAKPLAKPLAKPAKAAAPPPSSTTTTTTSSSSSSSSSSSNGSTTVPRAAALDKKAVGPAKKTLKALNTPPRRLLHLAGAKNQTSSARRAVAAVRL